MRLLPTWEVFALRQTTVARRRIELCIHHDLHDGPQAMGQHVWLLRRGMTWCWSTPASTRPLAQVGVAADAVRDMVITHAHDDHAGNLDRLPQARLHLQEREMDDATGRNMRHRVMRQADCVDDVCALVRLVYQDRVANHDDDWDLRPGVSVHLVGGQTHGLQVVRVHTARGWIVLASDAAHDLENLVGRSPFPIVADVGDMLRAHARIEGRADSPAHIVPGHDPQVLTGYARVGPAELEMVSLSLPLTLPAATSRP